MDERDPTLPDSCLRRGREIMVIDVSYIYPACKRTYHAEEGLHVGSVHPEVADEEVLRVPGHRSQVFQDPSVVCQGHFCSGGRSSQGRSTDPIDILHM